MPFLTCKVRIRRPSLINAPPLPKNRLKNQGNAPQSKLTQFSLEANDANMVDLDDDEDIDIELWTTSLGFALVHFRFVSYSQTLFSILHQDPLGPLKFSKTPRAFIRSFTVSVFFSVKSTLLFTGAKF